MCRTARGIAGLQGIPAVHAKSSKVGAVPHQGGMFQAALVFLPEIAGARNFHHGNSLGNSAVD